LSDVQLPITKSNILRHEWIGLKARVIQSTDPGLRGREGIIVDETKRTIVLEEGKRKIVVPKEISVFRITLPTGEEVEVDGRKIIMRPEERIKNLR
jgi:ribonuclease P protein subunit POP4